MTAPHPLLGLLHDAALGSFPPPDGGVTFLPALPEGRSAVVSFTAHAVVASHFTESALADLALDGYGRALSPDTLLRLAGGGDIGVIDVTLVARGAGGGELPESSAWDGHPRVHYARRLRADVRVHGDARGFVTIATGLAGRREMSVELTSGMLGHGVGRSLVAEARRLVAPGELLFAAVSPGNARSLRAFLAAGFTPIGSEVLITPPPAS